MRWRPGIIRRAARIVAAIAVALVLLALAAAAAGYAWLSSDAGERWLKGRVLATVNESISGRITTGPFHVRGLSTSVEGLVLHAPGGEVVATAERLTSVSLLGLAQGDIVLEDSAIEGLVADVDLLPSGVPLLVAVRPPPGPKSSGGGGLVVRDLRIAGARAVVRQRIAPGLAPRLVADGLDGWLLHEDDWRIRLDGAVRAPVEGALHVAFSTDAAAGGRTFAGELWMPGLSSSASASTSGPEGPRIALERLELAPATARALWPSSPLAAAIAATGTARRHGGAWAFGASARSPAGDVRVRGRWAPDPGARSELRVEAERLDVRGLLGAGPSTRLDARASAAGTLGASGPAGSVSASASGAIAGIPVEALALEGRGTPEAARARLRASLPGARVAARGTLREGRIAAQGLVTATDLGALAGAAAGPDGAPSLSGAGRARIALEGPLSAPALEVEARLDALRAGAVSLHGVRLEGSVADVSRPLSGARAGLVARASSAAGHPTGAWRAVARASGGRAFAAAWRGDRRVFRAAARLAPDLGAARVEALALELGGVRWRLDGDARVAWRGRGVAVDGLALEAGRQRIAVAGRLDRDLRARASVRALDLGALSRAAAQVLPSVPRLSGRATGEVTATGDASDPSIAGRLEVAGGPVPRLDGFTARLLARREPGGELTGRAAVTGHGARARARFSTTDDVLSAPLRAPLAAEVQVEGALAAVRRMAGLRAPLSGRIAARGRVEGPLSAPRLWATAELEDVVVVRGPPGALQVSVAHAPGRTRALARGTLAGGSLSVRGALRTAPSGRRVVDATLEVEGVDAAPLAALGAVRSASGRVDANVAVSGRASAPEVRGHASWTDGALATRGYGRYRGIRVGARAGGGRVTIDPLVVRSGHGRLAASLEGAIRSETLAFRGVADLSAFPVVTGRRLRARADARLDLSGTISTDGLRGRVDIARAEVRLPPRVGQVAGLSRPPGIEVVARDLPVARWGAVEEEARRPRPLDDARGAPVRIALSTLRPALVRGPGIDVRASLSPGFEAVHDGRWGLFGTIAVPTGTVRILGTPVALLGGSRMYFDGSVSRPRLALGVRGSFEPSSIVVVHGRPGSIDLGLPPPGSTEREVFAALARAEPDAEGVPTRGPLPLVGISLPLARLLEGPSASSYAAGTPLTSRLRVATSARIGADPRRGENSQEVRVQLRVAPSLEAQGTAGNAGATSFDLAWARRRTPAAEPERDARAAPRAGGEPPRAAGATPH